MDITSVKRRITNIYINLLHPADFEEAILSVKHDDGHAGRLAQTQPK